MKRNYTDAERADAIAALSANGGNLSLTSRQLGIPLTTLIHWRDGTRHPEASQMGEEKKLALADRLEEIARQLADALPGKIAEATLNQVAVGLGIAVDKMQLLRGQPTGISHNVNANVTDADRAAALHGLLARVEAGSVRPPVPSNGHADAP